MLWNYKNPMINESPSISNIELCTILSTKILILSCRNTLLDTYTHKIQFQFHETDFICIRTLNVCIIVSSIQVFATMDSSGQLVRWLADTGLDLERVSNYLVITTHYQIITFNSKAMINDKLKNELCLLYLILS